MVNPAAINAGQRPPFSNQNPHNALSIPKVAPDIKAVLAAAGLEANPTKPHTIKKSPYPIYQRPMLVLLISIRYRLVLKEIVDRLVRQSVQGQREALRVPNDEHSFRLSDCSFDNVRGQ